jgi:SAM-dependent methyltransferase
MKDVENINVLILDLETSELPKFNHSYDGIIVSRYLHRPLLTKLADILNPSGVLIYETFMIGNERHGKPSNPDFLLLPDELLNIYTPLLSIIGFEQGDEQEPRPAVMQRICAKKHT